MSYQSSFDTVKFAGTRISEKIAVIGLGYVGLPVAVSFAANCDHVIGFDLSKSRVDDINADLDRTGEITPATLNASTLITTSNAADMAGCTFFVVTVPTPVSKANRPDFSALLSACATIGPLIEKGAVVVFESTVYPGATEEICGPALAKASGLKLGQDFTLGYSPERINPGDTEHRLETITKIIAGQDQATADRLAACYGSIILAGLHIAPSIKVAEAAKVIENTQRDVNIALMNELAMIFDRIGIPTRDVLAAAGTKWNFLNFTPGLVGGHCIGVDPYYLTAKAEEVGYHPEVILSGRRINDSIGRFIAQKLIKLLIATDTKLDSARVGILGLTFKENVPDLRNSKVPDIINELRELGIKSLVHDPMCATAEAKTFYDVDLCDLTEMNNLDAVILAVPHDAYTQKINAVLGQVRKGGTIIDVRGAINRTVLPADLTYWSL